MKIVRKQALLTSEQLLFLIDLEKKDEKMLINLDFKNLTDSTVKLLDLFEPMGVFFSINFTTEKGESIDVLNMGKIDFYNKKIFKYIYLERYESFRKQINLTEILKQNNITLPEGTLILSMAYHNQYGSGCINGWFNSNKFKFINN